MPDKINTLDALREMLKLSDTELKDHAARLNTEIKRRKHKGRCITSHADLMCVVENGGSIWWENGVYSRGYSAGFIANSSYARITNALKKKILFVWIRI